MDTPPPHHTHQNLKSLYRALNWVQSHSHPRSWFTQLLSLGCPILENSSYCGSSGQKVYSKDRGCGGCDYPAPAQRSTGGHILPMNSSKSKAWKLGELYLASSPLQGLPELCWQSDWDAHPPHCCTWENLTSSKRRAPHSVLCTHTTFKEQKKSPCHLRLSSENFRLSTVFHFLQILGRKKVHIAEFHLSISFFNGNMWS